MTTKILTLTLVIVTVLLLAPFSQINNAFAVSVIDFEDFSDNTIITTQYQADGVHFSSVTSQTKILDDSGEWPPGPPSGKNILVSNKGLNNGDIIISIVDPTTGNPTDASSIEFYLYSIGNNAVTVETKNANGDVQDTQTYQHIDVGGVNCNYPQKPDCPGPITNGWGQTDLYSFSGEIRTVTITSSQQVLQDGYGIDDVFVEFAPSCEIEPSLIELIAGQHIDSGDVEITNDGENLIITITTENPWSLSETHVSVQDSVDNVPQNKKGNPKIGHFEFSDTHDPPVTTFVYTIPLFEIDKNEDGFVTIAVHAVVQQIINNEVVEEETAWAQGDRFVPKGSWAMYTSYELQCLEEESITLALGPGWDIFPTLTDGSVTIENPSSSNWNVEFNLEGGPASTSFGFYGLDVFVDSCPAIISSFGDLSITPICGTFTRAGESGPETHTVIVYRFGTLSTDASGDVSTSTAISGIASGTYDIEFWIGSSVHYQSDGNGNGIFGFGDTKQFIIP